MNRPSKVIWGALLLAGCATTLKLHELEPNYDATDKGRIKRLAVVTSVASLDAASGHAEPSLALRQLWSMLARRYVNQKRDFIVKVDAAGSPSDPGQSGTAFSPAALCTPGLQGVLWLAPRVEKKGEGVEAEIDAQLLRCADQVRIWRAQGAGSWPSSDSLLKQTAAEYAARFGEEVEPFVAPTFHLLKAVLDTLPNPTLTDQDTNEKIELGD